MLTILNIEQTAARESASLTTVKSVDLQRYVGLWYEIAKIPNRFQKKCAYGTTAEYALREDGRIDVINSCYKADDAKYQAQGIARIVDSGSNAKLEVSFVRLLGFQLFWGDYWIIGLGENYEYAIVGTPGRKYGWILSRTPIISPENLEAARRILREQGYDPDDFVMTEQKEMPKMR